MKHGYVWSQAIESMKATGKEIMEERGGEFSFGEWAGESEREIIENITGLDYDRLSPEDIDELCNTFLGM